MSNQRKLTFGIIIILLVLFAAGSAVVGSINAQNRVALEREQAAEQQSTQLAIQVASMPTATPVILTNTPLSTTQLSPAATTGVAVLPTDTAAPTQTWTPSLTRTPTFTRTPSYTPSITFTPSITPSISLTPSLTLMPTASPTFIPGAPTPVAMLPTNNYDLFNVLLVGMDDPGTTKLYRADTIIVVSINRTTGTVTMLSIPRDLYLYIPTVGLDRINTATVWGDIRKPGSGLNLLIETIRYNFGIQIDRFARVDFVGFEKLIDEVGGLDIAVDCSLTDHIDFTDFSAYRTINIGMHHMDGQLALWYARSRKTTSDFERSRRQQVVLRALWHKMKADGLLQNVPTLWDQVTKIVYTNITLTDVVNMLPLALDLGNTHLRHYQLNSVAAVNYITPAGAEVLLPKWDVVHQILSWFYTPPTTNSLNAESAKVELLNGTDKPDWSQVAMARLDWSGFTATDNGKADKNDYQTTMIYDYTGGAKPSTLKALARVLNVPAAGIISAPNANRDYDFRVILGATYNSCYGVRNQTGD